MKTPTTTAQAAARRRGSPAGSRRGGCACNSSSGAEGETETIRYQTNAGLVDLPELADALGYLDGIDARARR